jgi:hypothetical protein
MASRSWAANLTPCDATLIPLGICRARAALGGGAGIRHVGTSGFPTNRRINREIKFDTTILRAQQPLPENSNGP